MNGCPFLIFKGGESMLKIDTLRGRTSCPNGVKNPNNCPSSLSRTCRGHICVARVPTGAISRLPGVVREQMHEGRIGDTGGFHTVRGSAIKVVGEER